MGKFIPKHYNFFSTTIRKYADQHNVATHLAERLLKLKLGRPKLNLGLDSWTNNLIIATYYDARISTVALDDGWWDGRWYVLKQNV